MTIKKGDFIELDYTARIADDKQVYDTTILKEAEKAGLVHEHSHDKSYDHSHEDEYKPIQICVGEKHVLPGLDKKLEGLSLGKHEVNLPVDKAFGKKNPKQLRLIPMSVFKKQNIQPYIGLQLNIDNQLGTVRNVSGGRVIVDFNHPLAGKEVTYDVDIKRKIDGKEEQIKAILNIVKIPYEKIELNEDNAKIILQQEIPGQYLAMLKEDINRTTGIKAEFANLKQEKESKKDSEEKKE